MLKILYRLLTYLIYPIYRFFLLPKRVKRGKEDSIRYIEKLGIITTDRPKGPLVWFHAASVGESMSFLKLINKIMHDYPTWRILITSGTHSSAEVIKKQFPQEVIHQYVPLDFMPCVRRFLKHWQPDLMVWVDSELWPNLIFEAHKKAIPLILLNMRISARSMARWMQIRKNFIKLLSCFSTVLTQTKNLKGKLEALGLENVSFYGNLKYAADVSPLDLDLVTQIVSAIKDRPCWAATSTHRGEEELVLQAHRRVQKTHRNGLLILVPRHPTRCEEVQTLLDLHETSFTLFSTWLEKKNPIQSDVLLVDSIGILGLFYAQSTRAFIGGSLVKGIGGHNVLEPLRQQCIPLYGPFTNNFHEIIVDIENAAAGIKVKDANDLADQLLRLMSDKQCEQEFHTRGKNFLQQQEKVLESIMGVLTSSFTQDTTLGRVVRAHA